MGSLYSRSVDCTQSQTQIETTLPSYVLLVGDWNGSYTYQSRLWEYVMWWSLVFTVQTCLSLFTYVGFTT